MGWTSIGWSGGCTGLCVPSGIVPSGDLRLLNGEWLPLPVDQTLRFETLGTCGVTGVCPGKSTRETRVAFGGFRGNNIRETRGALGGFREGPIGLGNRDTWRTRTAPGG